MGNTSSMGNLYSAKYSTNDTCLMGPGSRGSGWLGTGSSGTGSSGTGLSGTGLSGTGLSGTHPPAFNPESLSQFGDSPAEFKRRGFLSAPQARFWWIKSGFVRTLSYREDGVVVAIGLWGPGDVVGKPLSKADPYLIEAVTKVEAIPLAAADWQLPTAVVLRYLQEVEALMLARASYRVDMALLGVLRWLANRFGQHMAQGCLIDLTITHQDLADFSGTTRVTVTRLLRQFEEQGLIYRHARQLILAEGSQHWHYTI